MENSKGVGVGVEGWVGFLFVCLFVCSVNRGGTFVVVVFLFCFFCSVNRGGGGGVVP